MLEVDSVPREQIEQVERKLRKHYGDIYADVWVLGVNVALRISDLLSIRLADVVGRDTLTLTEAKTGKVRLITLNARARDVIKRRAAANPHHEWLFQSTSNRAKASCKPITRQAVSAAFKEVGEIVGIHLGTHSMRKTRGRAMFEAGTPLEVISKSLNHSSTGVTMRYIGIEKKRIQQTYDDFVL